MHRRTRRVIGEGGRPLAWKISGQTLFSGQAQVAQKSRMVQNISVQRKIPGHTLLFTAGARCSKILNDTQYFNTVRNFRATLFFRASASSSKSWMIKVIHSIAYSEFRTHSVFQGKRKLLKNPECKNIFNTVKSFRAHSVFQGKRKLLKNPECEKYIQCRVAGCYDIFFLLTGVLEAGRTNLRIAWTFWVRVFMCIAQAHSNDNAGRCRESDPSIRNRRF